MSSEIVFYQGEDGRSRIQVRLQEGTVWLTQRLLAELYQVTVPTINEHIKNILADEEVDPTATIRKFRIVQVERNRDIARVVEHYDLSFILAVGYRVRSPRGVQFRRWATEHLREYLTKGFVLDDERLKEGRNLGADYFDELLERIREIRASEKRFYQKIRDIYLLAIDYDPTTTETKTFFQVVQNKLHWAISGSTAAELIAERASADKPNMGLTTWKGVKVRKADVLVAKNYLSDDEMRQLNRIVTMYLDYAEEQAERRKPLYMRDWREKLDGFLKFNERDILRDAGRVSAEVAKSLALGEYAKFEDRRRQEEALAPDPFDDAAGQLISHEPRSSRKKTKSSDKETT